MASWHYHYLTNPSIPKIALSASYRSLPSVYLPVKKWYSNKKCSDGFEKATIIAMIVRKAVKGEKEKFEFFFPISASVPVGLVSHHVVPSHVNQYHNHNLSFPVHRSSLKRTMETMEAFWDGSEYQSLLLESEVERGMHHKEYGCKTGPSYAHMPATKLY